MVALAVMEVERPVACCFACTVVVLEEAAMMMVAVVQPRCRKNMQEGRHIVEAY